MANRKRLMSQNEQPYIYCLKATLPFLSCLTLMLLGISHSIFTYLEGFSVFWLFIGIFYWSFSGNRYFHPMMALFFGIWLDLLIGQIIGLYSVGFMLCYIICNIVRDKFWNNSVFLSLAIYMAMLFIPFFSHIIVTLAQGHHANFGELILSMLLAGLCYMPLHGIFTFLRQKLW